jgi:two-component sensor histidine kinase
MHPILGQFRRLALYLLAWVPLALLLIYLLAVPGGLSRQWAAALVVPLCVIYAFVCLSAWYLCRSAPLETTGLARLALTHLAASVLMSLLWLALARGLASVLTTFDSLQGIDQQIGRQYPLLFGSGVLLYMLAVALHYVLLSSEASREAERREMQARVLARESELRALKAQVNPHFLFNSLHSISALTSIDAARARQMCIQLADFLRATLGLGEKTSIPLSEELALVRLFLAVEKVRFGARLNFEEHVAPEALDFQIPPLLLQPLVENAVAHGISNLTEGGWIRLTIGSGSKGDLAITLENNFDREMPSRRGTGMGLKNVRRRLDMRYGERANFDVSADGDRFRVTVQLPAEETAHI